MGQAPLPMVAVGVAQAEPITVANPSFETLGTSLGDGWYTLPNPAGQKWVNEGATYSIFKVLAEAGSWFTTAADGSYVYNFGPVAQDLLYTVEAGAEVELTFYLGHSLTNGGTTFADPIEASILVGGTPVAEGVFTAPAVADTWELRTLQAEVPASGNLSIAFRLAPGSANGAWLDNVAVDVAAVPEPTAAAGLCLGLAMLGVRRRRGM